MKNLFPFGLFQFSLMVQVLLITILEDIRVVSLVRVFPIMCNKLGMPSLRGSNSTTEYFLSFFFLKARAYVIYS